MRLVYLHSCIFIEFTTFRSMFDFIFNWNWCCFWHKSRECVECGTNGFLLNLIAFVSIIISSIDTTNKIEQGAYQYVWLSFAYRLIGCHVINVNFLGLCLYWIMLSFWYGLHTGWTFVLIIDRMIIFIQNMLYMSIKILWLQLSISRQQNFVVIDTYCIHNTNSHRNRHCDILFHFSQLC